MPTLTILLSPSPPCASPSRPWRLPSRRLISSLARPSITKKCNWIQCGNAASPQFSDWVGIHVPAFRQMQISDHARYLGVEIGPGAAGHRWTKARNMFVGVSARVRSSSQSRVQWLVSVEIYAVSGLTFVGSVAEPDKAAIAAENLALQRLSARPFHALLAALLRRRSTCGLKIDADGIQLTSNAARCRVASRSEKLSTGMARMRVAKDYDGRTFDSCARSWDDLYLHSSTAHFTAAAFRSVHTMDSVWSLRNLLFHKMQSGAAAMIRQSGNIFDIASAICSRSNRALGVVSQHRGPFNMKVCCRTANSCRAGIIVGSPRVAPFC